MSDFKVPPVADGRKLAKESLLDGQGLRELIIAGMTWLKTNQQTVNALNVFPVPDGDTGTNMLLTMQAAYNEIANSGEKNVGKMAHAIAQGALMGARGNSGVILSQLFRGFARGTGYTGKLPIPNVMVKALNEAKTTAYKGVVRPVEGTILTVAKDVAAEAEARSSETQELHVMLERIVEAADRSVKHTPELLPILKQAGVVDSGGKGLFYILEGMLRHLNGQALDVAITTVQPLAAMQLENAVEQIEEGQDYEVVVDFQPEQRIRPGPVLCPSHRHWHLDPAWRRGWHVPHAHPRPNRQALRTHRLHHGDGHSHQSEHGKSGGPDGANRANRIPPSCILCPWSRTRLR